MKSRESKHEEALQSFRDNMSLKRMDKLAQELSELPSPEEKVSRAEKLYTEAQAIYDRTLKLRKLAQAHSIVSAAVMQYRDIRPEENDQRPLSERVPAQALTLESEIFIAKLEAMLDLGQFQQVINHASNVAEGDKSFAKASRLKNAAKQKSKD